MGDYEAVARLTGCGKLHGAQGPAPTIVEMVEAFERDVDDQLMRSGNADLVGVGLPSIIATLALRTQPDNP